MTTKKQAPQKRTNNPITTKSKGIVCKDLKLTLSNEKLKGLMLHLYETARDDANKFKWFNHFETLISLDATLFITLITTNFKNLTFISNSTLETITWGIFCCLMLLTIASIIYKASPNQHKNENTERDNAVEKTLEKLINENNIIKNAEI